MYIQYREHTYAANAESDGRIRLRTRCPEKINDDFTLNEKGWYVLYVQPTEDMDLPFDPKFLCDYAEAEGAPAARYTIMAIQNGELFISGQDYVVPKGWIKDFDDSYGIKVFHKLVSPADCTGFAMHKTLYDPKNLKKGVYGHEEIPIDPADIIPLFQSFEIKNI